MSEPASSRTFAVTVEDEAALRWAAASAKCSTVERFIAEAVALAIADELNGGPVVVHVDNNTITLVAGPELAG